MATDSEVFGQSGLSHLKADCINVKVTPTNVKTDTIFGGGCR